MKTKHSEESEKIRKNNIKKAWEDGKYNKRKKLLGDLNPSKRIDVRKKISLKKKGIKNPGQSKRMMGHVVSIETRKKLRLANIGKLLSKETKEKISKSTKGINTMILIDFINYII